jgi:hypothetical protein
MTKPAALNPVVRLICFEGNKKDMKIIALEEHFRNAAIEEAVKKALPPSQRDFFVASMALSFFGGVIFGMHWLAGDHLSLN